LNYSRKVIFSILAVALLGSATLAYAITYEFSFNFGEFGTGNGQFDSVEGVAVNSTHILVVDEDGDRIQIFDTSGNFAATFGTTGAGNGQFNSPGGVVVNSTHILVAGGSNNDRVQIFNLSGQFADTFGSTGATNGQFNDPQGITINATHILVADRANHSVSIFNLSGQFQATFGRDVIFGAPTGFEICTAADTCKTGVTGTGNGEFNTPTDIVQNSTHILVADRNNNRVQVFNLSGQFVSTFGSAGTGAGNTATPSGIDFDSNGNIVVSDTGNDRISIFDTSGNFVSMFGFAVDTGAAAFENCTVTCQAGTAGSGDGEMNTPFGLAVDSNDRIITGENGADRVSVFALPSSPTPATSSGGGESESAHKTRPTFGLDHNTLRQLIEGGFSFNGVSHDITDNWWTPFEEQNVKIGSTNSFTAKAFADKQLRIQEFLFGIPAVGEAHKAELGIEVVYDYSGEIEMINVVQKTDIIDIDSIKVIHSKSKCQSNDTVERCDTTRLSMKFLEPLQDKIMAIKAIDFKGRVHITYLNEGFDISGNSLNPMNTMMIPSTEKYEGLVEVTQTAKYSDIWTTQDDREFEMNEYGSFKQINQIFENDSNLMDKRFSSDFADYKKSLADKYAKLLLESCPNCFTSFADFDDSFAYSGIIYDLSSKERIDRISHLIEIEKQKAIQVLIDAELAITYPDYIIDTDDRPISVILAEERFMKKLLADERAYLKQVLAPQQ